MARLELSDMLKYAIIVLVVLFSVLGASLCVEGPTESCGHGCCVGSDRSRLFTRLFRRLSTLTLSIVTMAGCLIARVLGAADIVLTPLEPEPLTALGTLRI